MMLILGYLVEFLIQTVFLAAALWIMIKVQSLNFNYPGLMGTAALTSAVELVLDHFAGTYISTGVVIGVLSFCVFKLTRADQVDVAFTVGVGVALVFGMNLFLLGWLMGDLRPSRYAATADEEKVAAAQFSNHSTPTAVTEQSAANTNVTSGPTNARPRSISENVSASTPPREIAAGSSKPEPPKTNSARDVGKGFSLKSITPNGNHSLVILSTGLKNYTVAVGEFATMATSNGMVSVRCKSVGNTWTRLEIAGQEVVLSLPAGKAL